MKFRFGEGFTIDTNQEPWRNEGLRVGFYANPGAGKSYTAALLVEQWLDQGGTVIIFEPRAEWHTLKQRYPVQVIGGPFLQDVPFVESEPTLYARVVVEQGVSMVFYTGDIEDEEKLVEFVTKFIHYVLRLQEEYHRPILLVVEETQEYAPLSARGRIAPPWVYNRMIKAFKDCFTQGRKLNVCPVAISQRPQEVNFTIRQLANLIWFGGFSSQDSKYLDTEVFAPFRRQGVEVSAQDLLGVPTGQWLVITGRKTTNVKVTEKRKTPHGADTPTLEYVAPIGEDVGKAVSALGEQLKTMLEKRAAEESELEKSRRKIRELVSEIEDVKSKLKLAGDLRSMLSPQSGSDVKIISVDERHLYQKRIDDLEATVTEFKIKQNEFEKLREENQKLMEQAAKYGAFEEFLRDIIEPIMPQMPASSALSEEAIEAIVDRKIQKLPPAQKSKLSQGSTGIPWVDMWLPKLDGMQQKIVRYIVAKDPIALTKSDIARGTQYAPSGGSFNTALSKLVKWRVLIKSGDTYRIAEAPV